jgi:hypothetical protein
MLDSGWIPHVAQPIGIISAFADADSGGTVLRSSARHRSGGDAKMHETRVAVRADALI